MKNLLFFILVFFFNPLLSQKTNKEVKKASLEIENAYSHHEYKKVVELSSSLIENKAKIQAKTFEYMLGSSYKTHDLDAALKLLNYHRFLANNTKIEKKMTSEARAKLESTIALQQNWKDYQNNKEFAFLETLIEFHPQFWQIQQAYGLALFDQESYPEAINPLKKASQWNQRTSEIDLALARCYFENRDTEKSLELLEDSYTNQEQSTLADRLRLANYYYLEDYESCLKLLPEIISKQPNDIEYRIVKYQCENFSNKKQEAYTTLLKILELQPEYSDYYDDLTALSEELGNKDQLKKDFSQLISKHPDEFNYYLYNFDLYDLDRPENFDFIVDTYDQLIRLDSTNFQIYYLAGQYVSSKNLGDNKTKKKLNLARKYLDKSIELNPGHFETYRIVVSMYMWGYQTLAKEYRNLGIKNFKKKIKSHPKDAEAYFELGEIYNFSTNGYGGSNPGRDSTLVYYDKALKLGYDSLTVLDDRRHVHWWRKNYEESLRDNYWVLAHTDTEWIKKNCYYSIANGHKKLKQYKKEKQILLEILKDFPEEKNTRNYKDRWRTVNKHL